MMNAQNAMLIFNPVAGVRGVRRELKQVIAFLEQRNWRIDLRETHRVADATTFAREAVTLDKEVVLVMGGNGTINEVVNGLAGSDVAVGLPLVPTWTMAYWTFAFLKGVVCP